MFISIILAVALGAAVIVQKRINTTLANRLSVTAIKGDKGDRGEKGEIGLPGRDGVNGRDGKDGSSGTDGRDGRDGADAVCTCNHTPEDREGIRALTEYLIQLAPHIGDDPRIQTLLKR
jgi:hypothetical protein